MGVFKSDGRPTVQKVDAELAAFEARTGAKGTTKTQDQQDAVRVRRSYLVTELNDLRKTGFGCVKKEQGPSFYSLFRWKYYNDIWMRAPLYNLIHPFFSFSSDVLTWNQVSSLLEVLSITTALILALVVTFHSSVAFIDTLQADLRFTATLSEMTVYNSQFGGLTNDWGKNTSLFHDFLKKDTNLDTFCNRELYADPAAAIEMSADEVIAKCCPNIVNECFVNRFLDADQSIVSGQYSFWWTGLKNEMNLGEVTIIQWFNKRSVEATGCLCAALITSLIMLATGSIHVFTRPEAPPSYQRDIVLNSYFYWLKVSLVLTVMLTILGIIFFFECIRYLVYIKFTDQIVAFNGENDARWARSPENTYGYVVDMMWYLIYFPVTIVCLVASKAQHHAYTFPIRPLSDLQENVRLNKFYRAQCVQRLVDDFLAPAPSKDPSALKAILPRTHQSLGAGPWGNKFDVFLAQAGGVPACEAEIVAHVLVDHGIDSVKDVLETIKIDPGWIKDLPGISMGAAVQIVLQARRLSEAQRKKDRGASK